MTPSTMFTYLPTMLDNTVFVMNSQGIFVSPVSDWDCATLSGAEALQDWLQTQGISTTIVMQSPFGQQYNWFKTSKMVPWLDDGKGAVVNAGNVLDYFRQVATQGFSYQLASWVALKQFTLADTQ